MKQTALADKYQGQTIDNRTLSKILKDMSSGITEDVVINRYKLKRAQYLEVKTYYKTITGPGSRKKSTVKDTGLPLDTFKARTGARRQGSNETCLCGTGRKYKDCCGKK